jgi:hypothetical protein
MSKSPLLVTVGISLLLAAACGPSDPQAVCGQARLHLADCMGIQPAASQTCDAATASLLLEQSCDQIRASARSGKADWWNPCSWFGSTWCDGGSGGSGGSGSGGSGSGGGGSGSSGEHGPTNPAYAITTMPDAGDWSFVSLIKDFQSSTLGNVHVSDLQGAQYAIKQTSYQQLVQPKPGAPKRHMAVELTEMLIDVPHATFLTSIPLADWGKRLANQISSHVRPVETSGGNVIRQVDRMVLHPFPCQQPKLANQDMTKMEIIDHGANKVYWRVYHSDNKSTLQDVGSVEFRPASGGQRTRVIFHSAHLLSAAGIPVDPAIIVLEPLGNGSILSKTFVSHLKAYAQRVLSGASTPPSAGSGGAPSGGCNGVTIEGCCAGNTVRFCHNGQLKSMTCASSCGWSTAENFYDCSNSGSDPSGQYPLACPGS